MGDQEKLLSRIRAAKQGITMPELVEEFGQDRHTITKYLNALEGQGLVQHKKAGMAKIWHPVNNPLLHFLSKDHALGACFKSIMDNIEDGISILDGNMRIIWANKKMKEIYGDMITGTNCYATYAGQDKQCPNCPAHKVVDSGQEHQASIQLNKQKSKVKITPIKDFNGETVGMLEVIRWQ